MQRKLLTGLAIVIAVAAGMCAEQAYAQPPSSPNVPSTPNMPTSPKLSGDRSRGLIPTSGHPRKIESGAPVSGARTKTLLEYTQLVQEQNQWCWAADGAAIESFHSNPISQNDFCAAVHGADSSGQCANNPATMDDIRTAYLRTGFSAEVAEAFQTLGPIQTEIDAGRPIETGIKWDPSLGGGGHAQVIYGYDANAGTVSYGDPWPSSTRYVTTTLAHYQSNSEDTWFAEVYGIAPQGL